MKRLELIIEVELTDKDYIKNNIAQIDPTCVTRENTENGIIGYEIPKDLINVLKKANADIANVTIIDSQDPNEIENYDISYENND